MKINFLKAAVSTLVMTFLLALSLEVQAGGALSGSVQIASTASNTITFYPVVKGSYSRFALRYCTPGSTWFKRNGGVLWDMTKSFVVPPKCFDVADGIYGSMQSSYTIQTPDVMALYGLNSMDFTVYFEVQVPVLTGGYKTYLIEPKIFQVVAQ
ncbi:hypothetical protein [Bdellovibrio svalbardensis]|uniref:Uncharacterized protein n=1 Tax=Bdellovibrio svalbardensis TaxID=2972972 RepID=A0ABT6DLG0_9BACT|nr:hypothetical protein [Bdellovibrio svalbardensis]MDG0817721.1 hypothetical protein [Bdellovibrio svalbardensis]